jgi:hypothetical protein
MPSYGYVIGSGTLLGERRGMTAPPPKEMRSICVPRVLRQNLPRTVKNAKTKLYIWEIISENIFAPRPIGRLGERARVISR